MVEDVGVAKRNTHTEFYRLCIDRSNYVEVYRGCGAMQCELGAKGET